MLQNTPWKQGECASNICFTRRLWGFHCYCDLFWRLHTCWNALRGEIRSWSVWGSAAGLLHMSQCADKVATSFCCFYIFFFLPPLPGCHSYHPGALKSRGALHTALCDEPLYKSNTTSEHQQIWPRHLNSALITGSVSRLGRKREESQFACSDWVNISRVADENTQETMHLEMMKPNIPPLAPGSSLIWIASFAVTPLCVPLVSLSPSGLLYSCASKPQTTEVPFANYSDLAVNCFFY